MDRILISLKKENGPRASSAPALGLNTIIFKHVYWYMQQTQVSVYRTIGPLVLIFAPKHRLWVPTIYVLSKNIKLFQLKIFEFFKAQKTSVYCMDKFIVMWDLSARCPEFDTYLQHVVFLSKTLSPPLYW